MSVGRPGRTNPKANLSLGLGIGSLVFAFFGGFLLGIPAMAAGYAARRDINLSGGAEGGRGRAAAGIVTGLVGTVVSALFAVSVAIGMWSGPGVARARLEATERGADGRRPRAQTVLHADPALDRLRHRQVHAGEGTDRLRKP